VGCHSKKILKVVEQKKMAQEAKCIAATATKANAKNNPKE